MQDTPPPPLTTSTSATTNTSNNNVAEQPDSLPDGDSTTSPTNPTSFVIVPPDQYHFSRPQAKTSAGFHPYTRPLTLSDLDSVIALENVSFANPAERASPEKLKYRLSKCGEICYGIFCTVVPGSDLKAATVDTARAVETSRKDGAISVLIGHIISAKASGDVVTDEAMDYPRDWASATSAPSPLGHQEHGRTIALHSVAILPEFQGRGLGRIMMLSYMQNMNGAGIADRLALIAHDHKVGWYEKLGWSLKGPSNAQFGGGGWFDMIFDLKPVEFRTAYG